MMVRIIISWQNGFGYGFVDGSMLCNDRIQKEVHNFQALALQF